MVHLPHLIFGKGHSPKDIQSSGESHSSFNTAALAGCTHVACVLYVGNIAATPTTQPKIQESDDDSSYSDITSATWTLSGSSDDKLFVCFIPLGGARKKYLKTSMQQTAASATVISVLWLGARANIIPNSDTERGVTTSVFIAPA